MLGTYRSPSEKRNREGECGDRQLHTQRGIAEPVENRGEKVNQRDERYEPVGDHLVTRE